MRTYTKTGSSGEIEDFLCNEDARLIKREGGGFLEYRVDGKPIEEGEIDAALSVPPTLTPEEAELFHRIFDTHDAASTQALKHRWQDAAALYHKAIIKIDGRVATITDAGKALRAT